MHRVGIFAMMTIGYAVLVGISGCGNPVDGCASFPRSDCCETDAQCVAYYGPEAGLGQCVDRDRDIGGTCTECETDRDCQGPGKLAGARCVAEGRWGERVCVRD